jgi:hypothetical protein
MNVTPYFFGEFNNGYTQYPADYASAIFKNFYTNSKSTTQIAIHREGDLMYYGYIRKLEQERYIGFCIVINGLILTKLDGLFSLYENSISNLVTNGQLIYFDEKGDLVTNVERLYLNREEIDLLTQAFRSGFLHFKDFIQPLPAVNYGVSKDSVKNFSIEDDIEEIIKSSHTYGYTYIYKSKGFNTSQLNSYKGVLSRLNKEKTELAKQYNSLEQEYKKSIKQKKQYRFVAILFLLVLGCAIGLLTLNNNLNRTVSDLNNANITIEGQKDSIGNKNNQITILNYKNNALMKQCQNEQFYRQEAVNALTSLQNIIEERQPFIVTSTSFNFNTGYLSFDYFGLKEESVKIQVRAYGDDGNLYSNTSYINVYKGNNDEVIYLNKSISNRKWYSFEILKDNIILGGDRH